MRLSRLGSFVLGTLATFLVFVACGGSAPSPKAIDTPKEEEGPSGEADDVEDDRETIFERYSFVGAQATFTTKATAFGGIPIDTQVVERMIRTRLRDLERQALGDLFDCLLYPSCDRSKGPRKDVTLPARDFIRAMRSLAVEIADADAKSQTVVAAALRDGLAVAVAELANGRALADHGCTEERHRANAAYLGLSRSTFLRALGFTESFEEGSKEETELELPPACKRLSRDVSTLVDAMATRLDRLRRVDIEDLKQRARDAETACRAGNGMSPQVRGLLDIAALEGRDTQTLRTYKALRDAFVRMRLEASEEGDAGTLSPASSGRDAGTSPASCFTMLNRFTLKFETYLAHLASDTEEAVRTDEIIATIERVRRFQLYLRDESQETAGDAGALDGGRADGGDLDGGDLDGGTSSGGASLDETSDTRDLQTARNRLARLLSEEAELDENIQTAKVRLTQKGAPADLPKQVDAWSKQLAKVRGDIAHEQQRVDELQRAAAAKKTTSRALDDQMRALRDVVSRIVDGKSVRRGDVLLVLQPLRAKIEDAAKIKATCPLAAKSDYDTVKQIVRTFGDALEQSIREDPSVPAGVRLDVPALTNSILTTYREDQRAGLYLRATIGAGYGVMLSQKDTAEAFYEELGVGYRWGFGQGRFLAGPHLATSGLLFQLTSTNDNIGSRVLLGGGLSLNAYKLLELSTTVGWFPRTKDGPGAWEDGAALFFGLQLPLIDYINAVAEGSSTTETTTAAK